MKTCLTFWTLTLVLLATCRADEPRDETKASFWMEKKLEYSQRMIRGLATEDLDDVAKAGRSMASLSQFERWVRGGVPEYRNQLTLFQTANRELIRAAESKNLDGATIAYLQLTLSCVNCHKVVRDLTRQPPADTKK
jgi:hypothetical protein